MLILQLSTARMVVSPCIYSFERPSHFKMISLISISFSDYSSDLSASIKLPSVQCSTADFDEAVSTTAHKINDTAKAILDAFFDTEYEGGRHQKRIDMIHEIDPGAFIIVTDAKEIRGEGFVGIK